jgi:hypothetical protein
MSEKTLCRSCGQPLPPKQREGVWLPAKKAEIFDFIDRYPGITADGIIAQCFPGGAKTGLVVTHIYQINSMLAGTKVRIDGRDRAWDGEGVRSCYKIVRPTPKKLAGAFTCTGRKG